MRSARRRGAIRGSGCGSRVKLVHMTTSDTFLVLAILTLPLIPVSVLFFWLYSRSRHKEKAEAAYPIMVKHPPAPDMRPRVNSEMRKKQAAIQDAVRGPYKKA
jgi:hypothetical protein